LNPGARGIERFGVVFRSGDKVMQVRNNYDKDVFNGDIGRVSRIEERDRELSVVFDDRLVVYRFEELDELTLSYAVTIHKSQGSEYPCILVPLHTQHFVMLKRNLLYTAITRARRLAVLVGTRKALAIAVRSAEASARHTALFYRLQEAAKDG
jgi:exodeoxyribonuclease V alpha subunit